MRDDFVVLILSHGRAGNVPTVNVLDTYGYTGDWYIVIDHEDEIDAYTEEYGKENVYYFDKDEMVGEFDRGDNFDRWNCNVYARNKCFEIADELGYDYFFMLDDDYSWFQYRFNELLEYELQTPSDFNFDNYIDAAIRYLNNANLDTLCMAQGGDFIGGRENWFAEPVQTKRKAMNTFLFRTDRPVEFRGTMNEDVNTYVRAQQLGKVFLTTNIASAEQESTQNHDGGLTDLYLDEGTYVKSFYTILYSPSSVQLQKLKGNKLERIHHYVESLYSVPKIVPESTKN